MKHFMRKIPVYVIAMPIFLAGCSKKESPNLKTNGTLQVNIGISVQQTNIYNNLKAAYPDSFDVTIYNAENEAFMHYNRAATIPESIELPEGDYSIIAHSNNNMPAAFENDYYYGTSGSFTITAAELQQVNMVCSLANIPVSVVYGNDVITDFSDYETRVYNSDGYLTFGMTETRTGYFNSGPLYIESVLEYLNGEGITDSITLSGIISDAIISNHYRIHIDASLTEGFLNIGLSGNEEQDTIDIILNNDDIVPVMSGELMITELMYNPSALADGIGEYIEVFNCSEITQNLNGLVIRRGSNNNRHTIDADIILAPGEYALLANSTDACTHVDYVYTGVDLLNSGDEILMNTYGTDGTNGAIICRVDYGANGFIGGLNGSSLQLSPEVDNANDALQGTNWCASNTTYSTGDNGSPGVENNICE